LKEGTNSYTPRTKQNIIENKKPLGTKKYGTNYLKIGEHIVINNRTILLFI
jgi:hypothetical protein